MIPDARIILYHKQATSARTRFLCYADESVCGFAPLPALATVVDEGERRNTAVAPHPAQLVRRARELLELAEGELELETDFGVRVDVPGAPLCVYLARLTTIDPPFDAAAARRARFVDLTEARHLPAAELELLRRAYVHVMEG